MRDVAVLFIDLIVTIGRLFGPDGARSIVAESLPVKQQPVIRTLKIGHRTGDAVPMALVLLVDQRVATAE